MTVPLPSSTKLERISTKLHCVWAAKWLAISGRAPTSKYLPNSLIVTDCFHCCKRLNFGLVLMSETGVHMLFTEDMILSLMCHIC